MLVDGAERSAGGPHGRVERADLLDVEAPPNPREALGAAQLELEGAVTLLAPAQRLHQR